MSSGMTDEEGLPPLEGRFLESPAGWFDPKNATLIWLVRTILRMPIDPVDRAAYDDLITAIRFYRTVSPVEDEMVSEYQAKLTAEMGVDLAKGEDIVPISDEELAKFDQWLREYDKNNPNEGETHE